MRALRIIFKRTCSLPLTAIIDLMGAGKKPEEGGTARIVLPLASVQEVHVNSITAQVAVLVDHRMWLLEAASAEEAQTWADALTAAYKLATASPTSATTAVSAASKAGAKACARCGETRRAEFSNGQWKAKAAVRRCKACIAAHQ